MQHNKQLDGLRCLSFLFVFFGHNQILPGSFAALGVNIFFALSGYLITKILVLSETGNVFNDLKIFYIRRMLRIFPVYYVFLLFLLSLGLLPYAIWHFCYLWNIKMFLIDPNPYFVNHFWSLCVEEQFYILYAPLLLFTAREKRIALFSVLIIISMILNTICCFTIPDMPFNFLLPIRGQYLIWGCLFGLLDLKYENKTLPATTIVFAGALMNWPYIWMFDNIKDFGFADTLSGIGSALIVFGLWRNKNKIIKLIFANRIATYLGKISYGLYIFHLFSLPAFEFFAFLFPVLQSLEKTTAYLITTILIASLSWFGLERPVNNLKNHFPYGIKPEKSPVAPDAN